MALSAADLQKKHELEGAPDPFPSLVDSPVRARHEPIRRKKEELDTESHTAFPSLAPSAPAAAPAKSAWGSANGPRIKPTVVKSNTVSDSFTLGSIDLSTAGRDGKPVTVGEIMKQVIAKYKVKIEASANQKARQTTFHIKAESQKELERAKRALLAALSPVVTLVLNAPASTIATIIGPKGATLKQIRDQTGVRVDIPPKDSLTPPTNGHANASGKASPVAPADDEEEEEPTVPVTITGPQTSAEEARALLAQIISTKTSRTTQRVRDIPVHVLPFVLVRKSAFQAAAGGGDATLSLNADAREITVAGEREAVGRVIDAIRSAVDSFSTSLTSLKMPLPRHQHRLLAGRAANEIMAASRCAVIVPKADEAGDEVAIWGQSTDLAGGVGAMMNAVNSKFVKDLKLSSDEATAKQILAYLDRIGYAKTVHSAHPAVSVYPAPKTLSLDIVGDKADVEAAVTTIQAFLGKLAGATKEISVDWLLHRVVQGKNSKKLKQLYEAHNVHIYFPPESAEQSSILFVYDPLSSTGANATAEQKASHLDATTKEVAKLVKDAADVKTQTLTVDKKWHDAVSGPGGTTLNAIIGEDKTLAIKIHNDTDSIEVRGVSSDVDAAVKEILRIVENAKNDEIVNSFSTEFDIDREYVGRVVGAHGAGINKLRDQLGVKVDVSDEVDDKEYKDIGKKKKGSASHQKSRVKITGRQENAEEAQRRILAQVERLADETSEVLKVPAQFHSSLIGQSGKYAIRLEEKYAVKITFPRQGTDGGEAKTREQLKPDEVLVKGGRKGVAGAKSELMDALEFEKESNHVTKFTVPTRSVARILGRGGASINDIKDTTGAQIDVDKASDGAGATTHITLRGTQKAINEAKAAILAISDQVGEETTETLIIENRFHRTLIGAGGQGLRDLVARCGGPSDQKAQAGLIRFPRQGEPSDEVRLRGEPKLVAKLKTELEKLAKELRDRVVLVVDIPAAQHRALIGRGGQHLNDLQNRTGAQVQFPGSRSYNHVGEPENAADFKDVDPANLIKLSGPRAACEKAIAELKAQVKPPAPEGVTATVEVPLKYHHAISQQGNFFRHLRSFGVNVDQSVVPQKSALPKRPEPQSQPGAKAARIDEPEEGDEVDGAALGAQWEVVPNHQDLEEGDSTWTLKARDQAGLDQARKAIAEAIEQAARMSHVGFLTLADRSMFPRIVGTKGANVSRLRAETGADITVGREDNTIIIIGSEADIHNAKDAILKIGSGGGGRGRRPRD
ncbi:hypothetical protein HGRIS_002526 [Hohenbuehelia grisea]|uniref:K Homology domain-containing protein n=1 Tax=Hohenbuehelia grisea TaxID=104357 RepID=A0ABR3JL97_9AGAR